MLKKFISYYKPHKKLFFMDLICAFMISGVDLIFPLATATMIEDYIPNKDLQSIFSVAGVLLLLFILRSACQYFVDCWGHILGVRIEYDMRNDIFSHVQKLSLKYFDNHRTGDLMSRIINDLREISELAHHGPEDLFISFVMLLGSFVMLIQMNIPLTLILFSLVPIIIFFAVFMRKRLARAFMREKKTIAKVNSQLEDSISGIRVTKSFANEKFEHAKFDENNIKFSDSRKRAFKYLAELTSGVTFLSNLLNLLALVAGAYFVYLGKINIGQLTAYILYVNYFLKPIHKLMQFTQQYESGMAGFRRFLEIISVEPLIVNAEDSVVLSDVKGDIEFKDVSFSYNDHESVLQNINLKIDAGKTLALVGPSGGGKTTICHLIPRFYEIDSGCLSIDGKDLKSIDVTSLRKNIGLVSQDVFLFAGTIQDNIRYGDLSASDDAVVDAAKKANIHDFIMGLPEGYATDIGERGIRLSGGQKQRLSIARVFLKNPPILILDEATSALDNTTESLIQEALEKLSEGRTSLVIAHRLSTIKNADEIVVITSEGIKERGSHESLIDLNQVYAQLYNMQFNGIISDSLVAAK